MDGDERISHLRDNGRVTFKNEDMEAYLNISPPSEGSYRTSEIMNFLAERGVTFGIIQDGIIELVKGTYYKDVLVAKGIPKEEGVDGWFEFLVDVEPHNEPIILPDGSVDYRTLGSITVVNAGDEIARYHPAITGKNGQNVRGAVIQAYRGKELRGIPGKGFTVSEDKKTYIAAITGKVEYVNEKLTISNLLDIPGDIDYISGNVDFAGDVIIRGNVSSGMVVKASGKIDIMGHVEAATISAGKEVVLHNGMQGSGKGSIVAGADVSGKFFEQTNISTSGNINANSILNCNIKCDGYVEAAGSFGTILGGKVIALRGVKATIIGNVSSVRTDVTVGVGEEIYSEIILCDKRIRELGEHIEKINKGIAMLAEQEGKNPLPEIREKKLMLMRAKIAENSEIADCSARKAELNNKINCGASAEISVSKRLYPGTYVTICGISKLITDMFNAVNVRSSEGEVRVFTRY